MNSIAEQYVKLVLAAGQHDPMYVDAYYGPGEWKTQAEEGQQSLGELSSETGALIGRLCEADLSGADEIVKLRREYLLKQLKALAMHLSVLGGAKHPFDEESRALYDIEVPRYTEDDFKKIMEEVEALVPEGEGTLPERLERFRKNFIIPADRVAGVFTAVIDEARKRTKKYISLPDDESFDVEFVTGVSWGAYNWYKGNAHSLIQVNIDLPTYIDAPVGLAAHEGYPGHHVYNALLEQHLSKERGWVEYCVYPLYSPQSLIAEGTANYGIEMAFPGDERKKFEREVLYPLAGLDPSNADLYDRIGRLTKKLSYARMEAARLYLEGEADAEETAEYLSRNVLLSPDRARKVVDFFEQFRTYIVNYYVGYDLIKEHMEGCGAESAEESWKEFERILSTPQVPSGLKK
ncbi:MAG: hypothetical protein JW746_00080 [Candidatus Krumholzibacteriota bacterium]|nr:hypothetical protein [Candidatus Krumholzibacteriota bacterium]